jgi:Bacterial Ig-like domain (group 2)
LKRLPLVVALLVLTATVARGQTVTTAIIAAPKTIVMVGEQLQLRALGRDNQGNPVRSTSVTWLTSNSAVVGIDSAGLITARAVGVSNVSARVNTATSPAVIIEVIPMRIDVTSDRTNLFVGEQLQLSAKALDVNGNVIPNVQFRWRVTSADGFTNAATVDNNGLLTAATAGILTVHAAINYTGISSLQTSSFEGVTRITVEPRKDYQLKRLIATDTIKDRFRLRPAYNSEIAVNDSGQIAFVASLDGMSSALVLYENGRYDVLASTGTPGVFPQSFNWHMEGPPAFNNQGQAMVRAVMLGSNSAILVASREGVGFLPEGFSLGALEQLGFFRVGRYSLNDRGDMVFLANFFLTGSRTSQTGLFLLSATGRLNLVWSTLDALPDFPMPFQFDNFLFGIDKEAAVYFTVTSGSNGAIYRTDELNGPVKVAGTGTVIDGLTVQSVIYMALSPNGTTAFGVRMTNGSWGVVVAREDGQVLLLRLNNYIRVLAVNDAHQVLFTGEIFESPGWGLYRWSGVTPERIMSGGAVLDGGETFSWARTAFLTSSGDMIAHFETPENALVVLRPQTKQTLFKVGSLIEVQVNRNFYSILPGAKTGPVHIFSGGGHVAVMQVSGNGVQPVWVAGDRPAPGLTGTQLFCAAKSPNGDLYVALSDGIFRISGGRVETLVRYPLQVTIPSSPAFTANFSNCGWNGAAFMTANNAGTLVWRANVDRLLMSNRNQLSSLMVMGGSTATPSPSGGSFGGLFGVGGRHSAIAIDDRNRVMVYAFVNGGPSGLFLYENGQWRTAALVNVTQLAESTVLGISSIKVANNKFYAMFDVATGIVIAEYDGQNWKPLVRPLETLPDGRTLRITFRTFDVNNRGDLAFIAASPSNTVYVRTADGQFRTVYRNPSLTDDGDRLINFLDLDLRDDGSVYFDAIDLADRNTIYMGQPRF